MTHENEAIFRKFADGLLDEAQFLELERALRESPKVRRDYVRYMEFEALLHEATRSSDTLNHGSSPTPCPTPIAPAIWNWPHFAAVGMLVCAAMVSAILIWHWPESAPPMYQQSILKGHTDIAIVSSMKLEQDVKHDLSLQSGMLLRPGIIRIPAGMLEISFNGGTSVELLGPAELHLLSDQEATLLFGEAHVEVPATRLRFVLNSPYSSQVESNSKYSLTVDARESIVSVFNGKLEVSQLGADGYTYTSRTLKRSQRMRTSETEFELLESEVVPVEPHASKRSGPLLVSEQYIELVKSHSPLLYWRFENSTQQEIENEVSQEFTGKFVFSGDDRSIAMAGGVAKLTPSKNARTLEVSQPLTNFFNKSFTIELWVRPESGISQSLLSLVPAAPDPLDHALLLEFTEETQMVHPRYAFRFLHRNPPNKSGGINLFTNGGCKIGDWHHLVAVRTANSIRLYHNGNLVSLTVVEANDVSQDLICYLGQLRRRGGERQFSGEIDEFAIYQHALTTSQVRQHYYALEPEAPTPSAQSVFPEIH